MRLVVVGLGRMGSALATALVAAGDAVAGFDIDADARCRARAAGVAIAASLADAVAQADVVITSLPTSAVVREVVDELADLMPAGSMLLEMSTCSPAFATYASTLLAVWLKWWSRIQRAAAASRPDTAITSSISL